MQSMATIVCSCGSVCLEAVGPAMMSLICHCTSCRTAGHAFDARSPVAPIVDSGGGTAVVLWRKDRVRCIRGAEYLAAHRLRPDSPSRRMVAACCGTPIYGDFIKGFWISIFRGRVADAPLPTMRVMTGDLPADVAIPDDGLPRFRRRPARFLLKLLATWATVGFRTPRVACVPDHAQPR